MFIKESFREGVSCTLFLLGLSINENNGNSSKRSKSSVWAVAGLQKSAENTANLKMAEHTGNRVLKFDFKL
jgi:hypothetical protein